MCVSEKKCHVVVVVAAATNVASMCSGAGDSGGRDGPQRPGGAGVVPEPESKGKTVQQQLCSICGLHTNISAHKSACVCVTYRCVLLTNVKESQSLMRFKSTPSSLLMIIW